MRDLQFWYATARGCWTRAARAGVLAASLVSVGAQGGCSGAHSDSRDAGGPEVYAGPDAGSDAYLSVSDALFDRSRRIDVELELTAGDWSSLGAEGRGLSAIGCDRSADQADDFSYSWFHGAATVDGERVPDVAVRKKGFLGSLSIWRPSLKLDFDNFVPQREFHGLEKLTLNNNRQDGSRIRQCLSYLLFERAGVPAPRCGFARVVAGGADLGTYANVEPITKRFLRARFGTDSGNLYEGQGADFLSARWSGFEPKTDTTTDRSDLDRLRAALLTEEAGRMAAIAEVLDLDAYLTYWTMEALLADWDSYSSTTNNFFLYDDPGSGFRFIPWGADATLNEQALTGGARPQSISASSDLSRELWALPEIRERYAARMLELLDRIWDVGQILDEIDHMAAVLPDADPDALEQIRQFVRQRRRVITDELNRGPSPLPAPDYCFAAGSKVSGSFRGVWGGGTDANAGSFELSVDGEPRSLTSVSAKGASVKLLGPNGLGVTLSGVQTDGTRLSVQLQVEAELFGPHTVPMQGVSDLGLITGLLDATGIAPLQLISDGTITFTEAGSEPGDPVAGVFNGTLYRMPL